MATPKPAQKTAQVPLWTRPYVMLLLLNFFSFLGMWMLPSLLPVYIHGLGAPDWMLGWVTGVTSLATIIARPASGYAVDRFGRRGIYVAGCVGMLVTALGYIFMPLVGTILALRFIQGLFWGMTNTSCTTMAADMIPRERLSEGMGYFGIGSSVAQIGAPALSLGLYYSAGEVPSVLVCASFFVVAFILSFFMVYTKPSHANTSKLAQSADKERPATRPHTSPLTFITQTLLERSALPASVLNFLVAFAPGIVQSYLATMLAERGMAAWATLFFSVSAVAAVCSRPFIGKYADKHGYALPTVGAMALLAVSMVVLAFTTSVPTLLVGAVLEGFSFAACYPLFMAMATRRAAPNRHGAASATLMVGFDIGNGIGAAAAGSLVALGGYTTVFLTAAALSALDIVVYLGWARTRT
jgi:MFS family permease